MKRMETCYGTQQWSSPIVVMSLVLRGRIIFHEVTSSARIRLGELIDRQYFCSSGRLQRSNSRRFHQPLIGFIFR